MADPEGRPRGPWTLLLSLRFVVLLGFASVSFSFSHCRSYNEI